MKYLITAILTIALGGVQAQTKIERSISVQSGQTILMHFDFPKLVRVTTWDKNEISVQGSVSINGGMNDDAFVMENSVSGNVVKITSEIRGLKDLPHSTTVMADGKRLIFNSKAEFQKYRQTVGKEVDCISYGPDIEITLEIKVPKNVSTVVESVYGFVEIKDFVGPLKVEATYGGVDAAVNEKIIGELRAETNYGTIYTNLDSKFGGSVQEEDFHTQVIAKPGTGHKYSFESQYGNVYLRKLIN